MKNSCQCLLILLTLWGATGFSSHAGPNLHRRKTVFTPTKLASTSTTSLLAQKREYSTEVRLREEAEAPFGKVRFFVYSALLGGCVISLLVSAARIAAGLNGINVDLMDLSIKNAAIDVGGLVILLFLLKNDFVAQESRLKRASKGGEMASLSVRGKAPYFIDPLQKGFSTLTLSSFRTGRGVDKRVVICAAGKDRISSIVNEIRDPLLQKSLQDNDLLVIPVILPTGESPIGMNDDLLDKECIAVPSGRGWKDFITEENEEAMEQEVDTTAKGFAIVLKKNGRVGQRTSGINLKRMVGEVEGREEMGMDVTNI